MRLRVLGLIPLFLAAHGAATAAVDELSAALKRRGYSFRQHHEEVGWTQRKVNVLDLDERQRAALDSHGATGLKRVLDEQGLWPFPAMNIRKPLPVQRDVVLADAGAPRAVVVAPAAGVLRQLAEDFRADVKARSGVQLVLIEDTAADLGLLQSQHVVLLGGSHETRFATEMALRYQAGFVDGTVPGEDGWVVTRHAGLEASGHTVTQVAASAASREEALACLRGALVVEGDRVVLRGTHRIQPGKTMRENFPSWEVWARRFAGGKSDDVAPVDNAIQAAQYYQRSGDPRALQLFRELLFRVADYYLKRPGGAFYPADLDFRIGRALLYYSRLEHEPAFSEEDRLILSNLLLACTRSIYEYTLRMWPLRPNVATAHNHETFAARSLMYAAEYFERYGVADAADWRKRVDEVFAKEVWNRFKQRENANSYETYAYDHAAAYSAFNGRRLEMFDRETLRWAARRHVIATDNFFRAVDYGDTGLSMRPGTVERLPILFTSQHEDPTLQWFAQECFDRHRTYLPGPLDGFTDLRRTYRGPSPEAGRWEFLPLDPKFAATEAPGFPPDYTFDKLAFRSGWRDEDHYLLFEGVGNEKVSHSHNNVNGIVRLNHLGRHLLVSNGYGRTVANPSSFGGRVRGPEDHNNLVLRRGAEIVRDLPVCSALLQRGQSGDFAYATGALLGYAGIDWFRTVLMLSDRFVLTLDRLRLTQPKVDGGHIEWNCPGEAAAKANGFRVSQQGVFFDVTSASGWQTEQGVSDRSNDWKNALKFGAYPYAKWPLKKLIFKLPGIASGRSDCLATLMAATRAAEPRYRISEPKPGVVRIEALDADLPKLNVEDADLSVRGGGKTLEVRFAPSPDLPLPLASWVAK